MLKHIALALLLAGLAFAQTYTVEEHLDEISKVKCKGVVPQDFACAILFDVDPPLPLDGIDIASVVGGESNVVRTPPPAPVIREVSLILDGTLYTAVYDPPLKRDDTFSGLRRNVGIPARVDGDNLFVKWPDGKEAKAKITRREKIDPNRSQPA
jgi:hypothetical protein